MAFLSASKQTSYLEQFNITAPGTPFEEIFTWENEVTLDLLKKMLTFNPFLRISIDECLQHPYFDDLDVVKLEKVPSFDADHIKLSFEDCSEHELRQALDDTFEYFKKN
jgi:serine/threonine protein kinase